MPTCPARRQSHLLEYIVRGEHGKGQAAVDSGVSPVPATLPERAFPGDRVEPPDLRNAQPAPDDHGVIGRMADFDLDGQVRRRLGIEVDVYRSLS